MRNNGEFGIRNSEWKWFSFRIPHSTFRTAKGQSVAEYAVVLSIVVAAVVGMTVYVNRSFKAKIKDSTDLAASRVNNFITGEGGTTTSQYEPYYVDTDFDVTQDRDVQETVDHSQGVVSKILTDKTTRTGGSTTGVATGADDEWR